MQAFKRSSPFGLLLLMVACSGAVEERQPPPSSTGEPPADAPPTVPSSPPSSPPASACPADVQVQDPSLWFAAGTNPGGYDMKPDPALARCGKPGLHIQSLAGAAADKFGTFMTQISPDAFRGKRLELRATMRTANVSGRAALWVRVDGPEGVLAFDNMMMRPISGTTELTSYAVVLDVANEARQLAFGVLLSGQGEVSVMGVEIRVR